VVDKNKGTSNQEKEQGGMTNKNDCEKSNLFARQHYLYITHWCILDGNDLIFEESAPSQHENDTEEEQLAQISFHIEKQMTKNKSIQDGTSSFDFFFSIVSLLQLLQPFLLFYIQI
jgi:hypothetical protein